MGSFEKRRPHGSGVRDLVTVFGERARLSAKQRALVLFAATGLPRKHAAAELGCSLKTADEHWRRICHKVGVCHEAGVVAELLRLAVDAAADQRAVGIFPTGEPDREERSSGP